MRDVAEFEIYMTLALNIAHLTSEDVQRLEELAKKDTRVMSRPFGFFVILSEHRVDENGININKTRFELSDAFNSIIDFASKENFRMIEFDTYVEIQESFPFHQ